MKDHAKSIYFILAASVVALGLFLSFTLGESQKTVPKIKLSYFTSMNEFAYSITQILQQEISKEKNFWFGVEPEKNTDLKLALELKAAIEKMNGPFTEVFIDEELRLTSEQAQAFADKEQQLTFVATKKKWFELSEQLKNYNAQDKKYFLLTASIYSTTFLKDNPIFKIKQEGVTRPMTFSSGYFSFSKEDERKGLFPCGSDNKEGVNDWACALVNKSRTQKRKLNEKKVTEESKIAGLMDLSGEKDYMILVH